MSDKTLTTKLEDPAGNHGDGYRLEGKGQVMAGGQKGRKESHKEGDGGTEEFSLEGRSGEARNLTTEDSILQNELKNAVSQTWVAPDGGWGWVVVASALAISLIVDGLTYTFGLFLSEFEAEFNESKSTVSFGGSIQIGVYLMSGPVVSALTNRFGCRSVIIAGSLITGVAFVVGSMSPNIAMLIATYGFLGGLGFGLMYLPAIVAVSVYFERRRAVATGIAVCGSGIGAFVLAPLTKFLIQEFNWRWTLVLLAGIILQGMICGALMRPLEPVSRSSMSYRKDSISSNSRQRKISLLAESEASGREIESNSKSTHKRISLSNGVSPKEMVPLITVTDEMDSTKIVLVQKKEPTQQTRDTGKDAGTSPSALMPEPQNESAMLFSSVPNIDLSSPGRRYSSALKRPLGHAESSSVTDVRAGRPRARAQTVDLIKSPIVSEVEPKPPKENLPIGLSFIGLSDAHINRIRDDVSVRMSRRDISKSVSLIPQDFNVINQDGYITSIISIASMRSRDGDSGGGIWNSIKETLEEMLDFGILKDKRYMFVLMGNFFCMIGFYVPFVYIPDRAIELGVAEDRAAFLISVIGITNIVGRVVTGVVVNFLKIDSLLITSLALATCGIISIVCPLCESYTALVGVSTIFGLGVAAYISLCSILLCELLGVKNLTNAFGFVVLFRGVACTVGPPIAGALIDSTGVLGPAFYLGGGMICLGSLCHFMLFLPCIKNTIALYAK